MESWQYQAAVIATHVQLAEKGFRPKDIKFIVELLSSWRWAADERRDMPSIHNNQILRVIQDLVRDHWLKPLKRTSRTHYRLTRAGLVGILENLRSTAMRSDYSTFWFLCYILQSYRPRLLQLIEREGFNLPLPQKMDVEKILDSKAMIAERKTLIQNRLNYWHRRINENKLIVDLVKSRTREKKSFESIVAEIENLYPYEMNLTKPLSTFISEIPEELKMWELTEGQARRANIIWMAFVKNLELELTLLSREMISLSDLKTTDL